MALMRAVRAAVLHAGRLVVMRVGRSARLVVMRMRRGGGFLGFFRRCLGLGWFWRGMLVPMVFMVRLRGRRRRVLVMIMVLVIRLLRRGLFGQCLGSSKHQGHGERPIGDQA